MKKSNRPKRIDASPATDATRTRRVSHAGGNRTDAGHQDASNSRTLSSTEGGSPSASDAATSPSLSVSTDTTRRTKDSPALMALLGHSPSCVALSTAGLVASCDCKPSPMHDPAIVIGVVMHYARLAMGQRTVLPSPIIELLTTHVEAGDPACIMVAEWLDRSGCLGLPTRFARRRRIRS